MTARKQGAETVELARLRAARAAVEERLDQLERDQREATTDLAAARDRVSQLERRAANGDVTDHERREAEADLAAAAARQREPWSERAEGVRAAIRDADAAIHAFVEENFVALLATVHERADQAAVDVNAACRRLTEAIANRAQAEHAVMALTSIVRRSQPGDVQRTRTEQLAHELDRLALLGGEIAPRLTVDPLHPGGIQPEPVAA